jgi:hypothetical protein
MRRARAMVGFTRFSKLSQCLVNALTGEVEFDSVDARRTCAQFCAHYQTLPSATECKTHNNKLLESWHL